MKSFLGKTMNYDANQDLDFFVSGFLNGQGNIVEKHDQGLDVLLTEKSASLLELPEHVVLTQQTDGNSPSYFYGTPLLEKMVDASCSHVPVSLCTLKVDYLKSQGFDDLLAKQFSFANSVGKIESFDETLVDYLLIDVRYLAQSDEQKPGLIHLAFNLDTGAYVHGMGDVLNRFDKENTPGQIDNPLCLSKIKALMEWVEKETKLLLDQEIAPFIDSMNRRYRRDSANLREYYQSLEKEMKAGLKRTSLSPDLVRDRLEKIAMLPGELERKIDDLYKKYSVCITIEPAAAMLIRTPAVKILYKAMIGKRKVSLGLYFNPLTKQLDPFRCQGCGQSINHITFCRKLHLLCSSCALSCQICRR
jgi:hypothetical protein